MLSFLGAIFLILIIGGVFLIFKFVGVIFKAVGFLLAVILKIIFSFFWIIVIITLATCIF